MPEPRIAPYGTWASPISTDLITGAAIGLGDVAVDGDDIYWLESRPAEAGRSVLVRRTGDGRLGVTATDMDLAIVERLEADGQRTVLFVDELHRFNRAQQDVLLGDVENGIVTLIGATTENPFFAINSPLVSRSQIFQFEALTNDQVAELLRRALADTERGLGRYDVENPPALERLTSEHGVTLRRFSDEILEAAWTESEAYLEEQAAANEDFRRVYTSWRAFRDESFRYFSSNESVYANFTFPRI